MFCRAFTSWFMAAMLLFCPFLDRGECCGKCPAHFAAQQAEQSSDCVAITSACDAGCGAHQRHSQNSESDNGEPSEPCKHNCPHSEHSDCLCGGAILPSTVQCPDQSFNGWLDCIETIQPSLTNTLSAVLSLGYWELNASHFPPLISGWEMRVHTSSYLL
jgi:hypothetical protein